MIEKMEKLYICSLREEVPGIMETLMRCGAVELTEAETMMEKGEAAVLRTGGADLAEEDYWIGRLRESSLQLKQYRPKKGLFYKRPEMTYEELTSDAVRETAAGSCRKVRQIAREKRELRSRLEKIRFRRETYLPWISFSLPVEETETKTCKTAFYVLPGGRDTEEIEKAAEEKGIALVLKQVFREKEHQYLAALFLRKEEKAAAEIMGDFGGMPCAFGDFRGTFKDGAAQCGEKIAETEAALLEKERELEQMAGAGEIQNMAIDAWEMRKACLSQREKALHTEKTEILAGWIPVSRKEAVSRKLAKFSCTVEYRKPEKGEDYPVLMKNSKPVEPFGAITEMYSLPNPHSADTNWAIGFFFFLFFGMMLSDAGYGLVLLIGGFAGAKFLDVGYGAKRMMKMLGTCGISTIFWGALYGSWFGDAIPRISETFFGKTVEVPGLIDPLAEPMTILVLSCLFGVVHLFFGMAIKAWLMIRRGDLRGALFDVGFWYLLLIGLPLLLAPAPWALWGKIMSAAGALGLVLTQGRDKPTVLRKLASGAMSLYNVTGYFSDVLSYSRILALGLATGVVASVVNIMGTMAGGGVLGFLLFAVVFAAGHLLNLGINALGAYVHSARLQYVEFFGKYYEGGGKKFNPLRIETKHVKLMEEE